MIARLDDLGFKTLQSLATRKYLLGVVLGWVLVVYLVTSPTPSAAPVPAPGNAPAHAGAPALAAPVLSAPSLSPGAVSPTSPSFGAFGPFTFTGVGAPPPETPPLNCPYPIPQSQSTPFSPGIFLSFEGPFVALSGPFASYDIPTLGAIAPLVPMATPLVYISEPVMNAITPNVSTAISDYLTIINDAGLNSPQEQQYAQQFEPYWLSLLNQFTPVEAALASSTPGQCLVLFENALAVMDSQIGLALPNPPLVVPAIAQSSSTNGAAAVEQATMADTGGSFAQLVLPSSAGVPADLAATVSALRAKGHPVELDLVDAPVSGQSVGTTAFPDFVAEAVHGAATASAFEVDVPSADPASAGPMADLVHGLASADLARLPGQVIGPVVPAAAGGAGAGPFWRAFGGAMKGYQPNMVDFVAADLTPLSQATPAADDAEAASFLRSLQSAFTSMGGVPAGVPVFATVSLAGSGPWSASAVQQQIAGYLGALHAMHLGVLGVETGS